jgi:hypothetical protein
MENFVNALATATLEPGEERELLWEARQVLGVPIGELRERLATARDHADARRRQEGGRHRRRDRRPAIPAPASKAEFTPTLHRLDEELATVDVDVPPFRTLDHRMAMVTRRPISELHQLVAEEEEPLPAPPVATIKVADEAEATLILEEHVRFAPVDQDDNVGRSSGSTTAAPFSSGIRQLGRVCAAPR